MNIIARNNYVLVRDMSEDEMDLAGGALSRAATPERGNRPCYGMVIAIGEDCKKKEWAVGQILCFDMYDCRTVLVRGQKVFGIPEDKIVGELPDITTSLSA